MPRFTSESAKEAWLEKVRATRAKKKGLAASGNASNGAGKGGIAGALEEIDAKIAALQAVRINLVRAQELVNL